MHNPGLAASAVAAVTDVSGRPGRAARAQDAKSPRPVSKELRANRRRPSPSASVGTLPAAGPHHGSAATLHSFNGGASTPLEGSTVAWGSDTEDTTAVSSPSRGGAEPCDAARSPSPFPGVGLDEKAYRKMKDEFVRQRELLMTVLRRSAQLEAKVVSLGDDLVHKNRCMNTMRQELQAHQDELQVQQQQFEQQQQALTQQHQAQQLQQLQQMQDLQHLLLEQQEQMRRGHVAPSRPHYDAALRGEDPLHAALPGGDVIYKGRSQGGGVPTEG